MRIAFLFLIALGALAGCGFKGPLYLPAPTSESIKPAAPPRADSMVSPDEQRPVPSEATPAPK
jgi:predicted small lipoprotein YifL